MISTRKLIYLALGLTLAGTLGIYLQLAGAATIDKPVAQPPQVALLVANQNIPEGGAISSNQLTWQQTTKAESDLVVGAITRQSLTSGQLSNALSRRDIKAGDYLRQDDLVLPADSDYLSLSLADGKRAIAISVDAKAALAGLVRPGDRVDVLFYHKLDRHTDKDKWKVAGSSSARRLISDVKLLALDNQLERNSYAQQEEGGQPVFNDESTVTLEVTVDQAERLAIAENIGQLSLILRSLGGPESQPLQPATNFEQLLPEFNNQTERANLVLMKGALQEFVSGKGVN